MATVAATVDYAGWVKELDSFDASATSQQDPAHHDPRDESNNANGLNHLGDESLAKATSRKMRSAAKPDVPAPPTSQAEELKQEMKLLNWHKLANEAALKAAIIKTNKLKSEDLQLSSTFTKEEAMERQQRLQQVIEEEQLKPLQVNAEFFREFESQEQSDALRMENDVQRHLAHLQRLKQTLQQRENMRLRRLKYRQGVQELETSKPKAAVQSRLGTPSNNNQRQDQDEYQSFQTRMELQKQRDQAATTSQADVVNSLGKLVELEKRIRQLESTGILDDGDVDLTGAAALSDTSSSLNNQHPSEPSDAVGSKTNVKFQKRKHVASSDGKEVSKTVYRVKMAGASSQMAQGKNKMIRQNKKPPPVAAKPKRDKTIPAPEKRSTFYLTSVPDKRTKKSSSSSSASAAAKATSASMETTKRLERQRLLRNMSERERRIFLKKEKAQTAQQTAKKQDVVIVGWLQKKQEAARDRKKQVLNASGAAKTGQQGGAAASTSGGNRVKGGRVVLPKVRVPPVGAASGKKANNPHMQKFEDMKKSFEKRKEQWVKPSVAASASTRPTPNINNKRPANRLAPLPKVNGGAAARQGKWSSMPPTRPIAGSAATSTTYKRDNLAKQQLPPSHGTLPRLAAPTNPRPINANAGRIQFGLLPKQPSQMSSSISSVATASKPNVPPPSTLPRLKP